MESNHTVCYKTEKMYQAKNTWNPEVHNTENDFFSRSLGPLAPVSAFSEQNEIGHKIIRKGDGESDYVNLI